MVVGDLDEGQALRLAAGLEVGSEHPLAAAIIESAEQRGMQPETVSNFMAIAGHGVEAQWQQRRVLLGNAKLMRERGIALGAQRVEVVAAQIFHQARKLAGGALKVKVHGRADIKRMKMGAFSAVAQGSSLRQSHRRWSAI